MSWPQSYQPTVQTQPLTVSWIRGQMCAWIDNKFCQPRGGQTLPMEGTAKAWQYVLTSSDTPTVLVCATNEKQRTFGSKIESDRMHRVDRVWKVYMILGHGFRSRLTEADGPPPGLEDMSDSVEALRDTVRGLGGVSEEFPLHYEGWDEFPPIARPGMANVFVAGAVLTFGTCNDIPEVIVVSK